MVLKVITIIAIVLVLSYMIADPIIKKRKAKKTQSNETPES